MLSNIQEPKISGFASYLPAILHVEADRQRDIYEQNRHRVYAVAFWMTDNELAAEELMTSTFTNAFSRTSEPTPEKIDEALIAELRELLPLGTFTLDCAPSRETRSVRYNILRVDLERAVVQLPSTEKLIFILHDVEGFSHARVASMLGISEEQAKLGLHQARLCIRQFLAN